MAVHADPACSASYPWCCLVGRWRCDDIGMSLDDLQSLANSLCYTYEECYVTCVCSMACGNHVVQIVSFVDAYMCHHSLSHEWRTWSAVPCPPIMGGKLVTQIGNDEWITDYYLLHSRYGTVVRSENFPKMMKKTWLGDLKTTFHFPNLFVCQRIKPK